MTRSAALFFLGLCAATSATAEAAFTLSLPLGAASDIVTAGYICDGGAPFRVTYLAAGPDRLAIVPIDGTARFFVNVIAASGARYVSGTWEWWSKGDGARLTDLTHEDDARDCRPSYDP